jgi:TolA-binding protein
MRAIATTGLMAAVLLAGGCASGLQQSLDQQQAELEAMQARLDQLVQYQQAQTAEIEAMRADLAQTGLKVTQAEEQVGSLGNRVENINTRLTLLTEDVTRMKGTGAPTAPSQPAPQGTLRFSESPGPIPADLQARYDTALRLYYDKKPREAITAFAQVLQAGPQSDLADNAEYWTGESYYMLEEFPPALEAFKRVLNHRFQDKYDDAQLKIGMTYRLMGQRENAIAAFRELIQKYPESPYLELARRFLSEIGG